MKETLSFEYKNSTDFFQFVEDILEKLDLTPEQRQEIFDLFILVLFENLVEILTKCLFGKERRELIKAFKQFKKGMISQKEFQEVFEKAFEKIEVEDMKRIQEETKNILMVLLDKLSEEISLTYVKS